jgi:hypothetical protein
MYRAVVCVSPSSSRTCSQRLVAVLGSTDSPRHCQLLKVLEWAALRVSSIPAAYRHLAQETCDLTIRFTTTSQANRLSRFRNRSARMVFPQTISCQNDSTLLGLCHRDGRETPSQKGLSTQGPGIRSLDTPSRSRGSPRTVPSSFWNRNQLPPVEACSHPHVDSQSVVATLLKWR